LYDRLKYLPWGSDTRHYVSLGSEERTEYEYFDHWTFGAGPQDRNDKLDGTENCTESEFKAKNKGLRSLHIGCLSLIQVPLNQVVKVVPGEGIEPSRGRTPADFEFPTNAVNP